MIAFPCLIPIRTCRRTGALWVMLMTCSLSPAAEPLVGFAAGDEAAALAWQQRARAKLFALMMGGAEPARSSLTVETVQRFESPTDDCQLEQLRLRTRPDRTVNVWLARPRHLTRPAPAVLALPGHGGTAEQIVRGTGLYWYGRELVRQGYVVISPDIAQHELQNTTWCLMGERTWDALRALDYVASLPEVDTNRLAVAGLSLGGETAMYVAALDPRVKVTCSSGWLTTVANMKQGHCPCFDFPGLGEHFDFSDIFACIAPRTLVCELGEQERAPGGFPVAIGRSAFEQLRRAYAVFGQENAAVFAVHPGGHVFDGREFWPRLDAAFGMSPVPAGSAEPIEAWVIEARHNAQAANEAFSRCRRYVSGWLAHADPATGLIPRNLTASGAYWNGRDAAADNYPFMVLTAAMTDRELFNGRMLEMLRTETRLTSRVGRLPDDYSFSGRGWRRPEVDLEAVVFEAAEYVKDGLLPITEWLGPSPWSERMIGLVEDVWGNAAIETPFGKLPTLNFEVGGDLLQASSRLCWFTGDPKYLDWAVRLGDYYLLGTHHPTRDLKSLRLLDHGCEVVNGLTELYVAVTRHRPEKARAYREPLHELFDTILARGRNPHGLLYSWFTPATGEHSPDLCDTFGYTYDGFYTLWLLDGEGRYRDAVRQVLGNLKGNYVGLCWGEKNADAYADSIEGALNLLNREPVAGAADWVDTQTRLMWGLQQADGVIEGWHGDGNFARTSLMYALWKTQGVTAEPWREDLRFGAVRSGSELRLWASAQRPWQGRLRVDRARHAAGMRLPMDYPRINQFPEWFVATPESAYQLRVGAAPARRSSGHELLNGLELNLEGGRPVLVRIARE